MRITSKDLEPELLEKINRLDDIASLPYDNIDGFVSYSASKGFYFKKTNDTYLKKLYTEDDFIEMSKLLEHPNENVRSSSYIDMRSDKNFYNLATASLLNEISPVKLVESPKDIRFVKNCDDKYLIVDIAGNMTMYQNGVTKYFVNVLDKLRENFAFESIESYDITDADILPDGFIFSVGLTGVYKYNEATKVIEMVVAESGIKLIKVVNNGNKLFAALDNGSTSIYMLDSGKKIETYYNMRNSYQVPNILDMVGGNLFLLGKSVVRNSDKLLHFWKEDLAGVNYNNKDSAVAPHNISSKYDVRFLFQDRKNVYLAGLLDNSVLFIWKYDMNALSKEPEEIRISTIDFFDISGIVAYKDQFLVTVGSNIYALSADGKVLLNLKANSKLKGLALYPIGIASIQGRYFVSIALPEFSKEPGILSFDIYEESELCNNIDIFVRGAGREERISLYNQADELVQPTAYLVHEGNTMIKLINSHCTRITMKLQTVSGSNISGIAVKRNRIFLR